MKLESLKSSKFEAFKVNEIQDAFKVVGGAIIATESGSYKDTYDTSSDRTSTGGTNPSDMKPIKESAFSLPPDSCFYL